MVANRATVGPYRLVRKLGEGGMGEVYEALHETLERQAAIKLLRPEYAFDKVAARRFFNEARATNRVQHPGFVQVWDYGQQKDGTAYIVMEYLSGETLGRRLKRAPGQMPLSHILHIGWQIASALAAAHQKGIIHRDLKPENVMLVPDSVAPTGERVKLLDFGLAKLIRDANAMGVVTRSNHIMGTPVYMSPEQCRGAGRVDDKSDVYSLGIILYEMLAGRPPFFAEGVGEIISLHLSRNPPVLSARAPQAPAELVKLVHSLLCKSREDRPSMQQVVVELEQLEARQGSFGAPQSSASTIANIRTSVFEKKYKPVLVGALDPEIEPEDPELALRNDSEAAAVGVGRTLGAGGEPPVQEESAHKEGSVDSVPTPPSRASAADFLFHDNAASSEHAVALFSTKLRPWGLVLLLVVVSGVVATFVLWPSPRAVPKASPGAVPAITMTPVSQPVPTIPASTQAVQESTFPAAVPTPPPPIAMPARSPQSGAETSSRTLFSHPVNPKRSGKSFREGAQGKGTSIKEQRPPTQQVESNLNNAARTSGFKIID